MRLSDLNPRWIRYEAPVETWEVIVGDPNTWRARGCPVKSVTGPREHQIPVDTFAEAQGIMFQCPLCHAQNGHQCSVTFADRGVTDELGTHNSEGRPSRWRVSGTEFDDLTTQPSIWLQGGCGWHGFVTNGVAE